MTMVNHRFAPVGTVNGRQMPCNPPPVPCEACGADVYLIDSEHLCRPGRRVRRIAVLAADAWQYVPHRCGEQAVGVVCGPCLECARREREVVEKLLDEADALFEEAERHAVEARRLLAEIDASRRDRLARMGSGS